MQDPKSLSSYRTRQPTNDQTVMTARQLLSILRLSQVSQSYYFSYHFFYTNIIFSSYNIM